jgi:putative membrane protein
MQSEKRQAVTLTISWIVLAAWAVGASVYPGTPIDEAFTFLPFLYLVSTFVHGAVGFGWAGVTVLFAASSLIAFFFESLSVHTGFPYGFYEHSNIFGGKIAGVPPFVATGYFTLTYTAWLITKVLVGDAANFGSRLWVSFIAALIATGFDLPADPIGATVHDFWTYRVQTGLFGVPLSNFLGWIVTCWVTVLAYTFLEPKFSRLPPTAVTRFWAQPPVFWAIMALQFPLYYLLQFDNTALLVTRGERIWRVSDVYETAAILGLFVMLPPALLTLAKLSQRHTKVTEM